MRGTRKRSSPNASITVINCSAGAASSTAVRASGKRAASIMSAQAIVAARSGNATPKPRAATSAISLQHEP